MDIKFRAWDAARDDYTLCGYREAHVMLAVIYGNYQVEERHE